MSKAVLISINPEGCDLILRGEKTEEVGKTKPKLETPFKVYIYCTKAPKWLKIASEKWEQRSGKVVGEFICGKIWEIAPLSHAPDNFEEMACLDSDEIVQYLNKIHGYGWYISDLKIYDRPRPVRDFTRLRATKFGYEPVEIQRPPQSWYYVEDFCE